MVRKTYLPACLVKLYLLNILYGYYNKIILSSGFLFWYLSMGNFQLWVRGSKTTVWYRTFCMYAILFLVAGKPRSALYVVQFI